MRQLEGEPTGRLLGPTVAVASLVAGALPVGACAVLLQLMHGPDRACLAITASVLSAALIGAVFLGRLTRAARRGTGLTAEDERVLASMRAGAAGREWILAAMSHDLRSPLNAIFGFSDLLLAELVGPVTPEQRAKLERVRQSAKEMLVVIEQRLDAARAAAAPPPHEGAPPGR